MPIFARLFVTFRQPCLVRATPNSRHRRIINRPPQSLDLEIALLRNGADVFALDVRRRLPLHYCFVKIGRHAERSRTDPIEVCSMLVEAMRGGEGVDARDEFLSTPLHYAAFRGATVCCLLLLEKGADIEAADARGNTPLACAVLGGHEACALVLLQKEANLNVTIYPNEIRTSPDDDEEEDKFKVDRFSFIPSHFERDLSAEPHSLFQGLVQNDWLGVTYMALQQLEGFGMSYARAVEVALKMQKVQFAKTLIGKQALVERLREKVGGGRNLLCCMAHECKATSDPDIQVGCCHCSNVFEPEPNVFDPGRHFGPPDRRGDHSERDRRGAVHAAAPRRHEAQPRASQGTVARGRRVRGRDQRVQDDPSGGGLLELRGGGGHEEDRR